MDKEKVQNNVQAIQWPNEKVQSKVQVFLWPLDCLYIILYFFFSHWIACTLFCTFLFGHWIAKDKVQNKVQTIQWQMKRYKIKYRQSNGQRKSTK
jgi:hypothetical protein